MEYAFGLHQPSSSELLLRKSTCSSSKNSPNSDSALSYAASGNSDSKKKIRIRLTSLWLKGRAVSSNCLWNKTTWGLLADLCRSLLLSFALCVPTIPARFSTTGATSPRPVGLPTLFFALALHVALQRASWALRASWAFCCPEGLLEAWLLRDRADAAFALLVALMSWPFFIVVVVPWFWSFFIVVVKTRSFQVNATN